MIKRPEGAGLGEVEAFRLLVYCQTILAKTTPILQISVGKNPHGRGWMVGVLPPQLQHEGSRGGEETYHKPSLEENLWCIN